ncbi:AIM24 family protein [Allostreptomyces psammosilenae]|uniref:Uncharacterized protein (AIM24 family) n=1 Tax=Allostreptomyces psammosilenae TaxID=1892865 RepID=A0A852ZVK9_9ACTN|nr:AIM24 family protein [Allostreptomyces psammosilenae]NYI06269.1 uncharacterized protein (AIM24 family) [Allostreptomyces psammosilenae]
MQSSLFGYTEVQSPDRYALQNDHMLRVRLDQSNPEVLARKGAMVAYQGLIDFDGEYESRGRRRERQMTGEGLPLMRCSGEGTIYFANLAQHVHVLDCGGHDGITVDGAYVLALDANLHREVVAVESMQQIAGAGGYNLRIAGNGKVALMTSGKPLVLEVTPDKFVNADADAVIAWTASLRVSMQAQTTSSSVFSRRGNTGEGWEMNFMGRGYVVVQPAELLPPQTLFAAGGGLRGQYGMGQQGVQAQNPGNSWGGNR